MSAIFVRFAIVAGAACALPCLARAEPPSAEVDSAGRADALYREGTQRFEGGQYSEAYAALRAAWDRAPSYRTAAGLGQVELQLGQFRDAAEHLAYCLRHLPASADPRVRAHVQEGLQEARAQVAALRILVTTQGAWVTVDGERVGRSPLDDEIFVTPGTHVVGATLDGHPAAEATVAAPVRSTLDVTLTIPPPGPLAPAPARQVAPRRSPGDTTRVPSAGLAPSTWALILGGGLTAASLTAAIVFEVKRSDDASALERLRRGSSPSTCTAPAPEDDALCRSLGQTAADRDTHGQIALGAALASGALAVATVAAVWMLPGAAPERRSAATSVRIGVAPGSGRVLVEGRF